MYKKMIIKGWKFILNNNQIFPDGNNNNNNNPWEKNTDNNSSYQQYGQNINGNNYQQYGQNQNINGNGYQQYGQNAPNNPYGQPFNYNQPNNYQPQNNYIPPQNNFQQPYNMQYSETPKKKSPALIYIILIAIIILFAVIIISMSAVMRSMMDGGDKKVSEKKSNDNVALANEEEDEESEKDDEDTENAGELSVPAISKFQENNDKQGDGVMVYVTWSAVENADGYEVEAIETENRPDTEPYKRNIITSDTYFETGASVPMNIKVKVRAYRNVDGDNVYSEWSEISECELVDFMKNKKTDVSAEPSYLVTINNYKLPIYRDASYENFANDYITDRGTYTITERFGHWGKLKNGAGWINLDDADNFGWTYRIGKAYVSTQKDPLTLRYAPLKSSKALGTIPKDESIYIYSIDVEGWYYAYYDGQYGFVDGRYVTTGNSPDKFEAYKLEINNYNLPIHKEPDYDSKVSGHIRDRDKYTIVDVDKTKKWGKLKAGGWINLSEANKFGWTSSGEEGYVSTKTDPLTLRYGPDTAAKTVTRIPKDEVIIVCKTDLDDWYYVYYKNDCGFVSAKYVTIGTPPEETTEQTETEPATERTEPQETEPPVTEPPVTEPPVTEPPVTEPPVTEPPVIDIPVDTPADDDIEF